MPKAAAKTKAPKAPKITFVQQASEVADRVGSTKANVKKVLETFRDYLVEIFAKNGEIDILGLVKAVKVTKPATEARKGINPITKAPVDIPAKPERIVVKARPRIKLKSAVG